MGKIWVEVCLISARGLRHSSSLWKLQWFAVGWIDPSNKYCTRIDASGNANPVWKTKFAAAVDASDSNFNDLALHVEVYSREPIFLRKRLQGTATILLREFLAKHDKSSEGSSRPGTEEAGSYQLRKRSSSKPQGFVDVSIRISEDKEEPHSFLGNEGGDTEHGNSITLATGDGPVQPFPTEIPLASFHKPENQAHTNPSYTNPMLFPPNYSTTYAVRPSYPPASGPSYQPPRTSTPPPPPPPANVGYIPTILLRPDRLSDTYINVPSSSAAAPPNRAAGPGFAMGLGAGALAAGAVIFGDDFMSGFDVPSGLNDPTLVISTDPPF